MYFLLKMGIFQPAMLVYQRVLFLVKYGELHHIGSVPVSPASASRLALQSHGCLGPQVKHKFSRDENPAEN